MGSKSFAADAIGFYLQVEDQMTPTLDDAADSYRKFVREIEKWNKRAYQTTTKGLGQLGDLVEAFERLPQDAARSYKGALATLRAKIKPVTQPINIAFTPKSRREIQRAIGEAMSKALSGVKLRLQPSMPAKRLSMFDTSANLRALWKGLAQPPDMKGKLDVKKFKHGGKVEGGTKGKDSVLGLLEPGEAVLSADVVKQFEGMRSAGGQFINPKDFADSMSRVQNLVKAVDKLHLAIDAGLRTPKTLNLFQRGMSDLEEEMESLTDRTGALAYQSQIRLAPALKDLRKRMEEFRKEEEDTGKVSKNLLEKILGPARFLAISTAANAITEGLSKLKDAGSQAFDALGGDQIQSFTTNMNQVNMKLHLTRAELRKFKGDAADVADSFDLNINEMSESVEGLINAGLRNRQQILALAPAVTSFSKANGIAFDESAKAAYRLTNAYHFTNEMVSGLFDDITKDASIANVSSEDLLSNMTDNLQTLAPALARVGPESRRQILTSFVELGGALRSTWGEETGALQGILARAMGGDVEAMQNVSLMFGKTTEELTQSFQKGDLTGLLDGLSSQIRTLTSTGNLAGLDALRQTMGFEGTAQEFAMLGQNTQAFNESLKTLAKNRTPVEGLANSQAHLTETANANRTAYEQLASRFGQLAAKEIPILGISMGQVIDLGKEFNVQTLLSIGYLGKFAVQAGVGAVKGLGALGSMLGGLGKKLGMFGGVTATTGKLAEAAGGAGKAIGAGGFFTGIAAGMEALSVGVATLGAVLISPPGIAFTVTFIAALLALAAAARIAVPALQILGEVAAHGMDALVKAFEAAVPFLQTAAQVLGEVLKVAIEGAVEVFKTLVSTDYSQLLGVGTAFAAMGTGLVALAGGVVAFGVALAGVQVSQGLLSLLGVGGVDAANGIFGLVSAIMGSLATSQVGPDQLKGMVATLNQMGGFVLAYGRLAETVGKLPDQGVFAKLFGDNPGEAFREQAGPLLAAISDVMGQASRATVLQQPKVSSAITPAQLQMVVEAVSNNPTTGVQKAATDETNALLSKILGVLMGQAKSESTPPERARAPTNPSASSLTREVAAFGY